MAKARFHALLEYKLKEVIVNRSEELTSGVAKDYAHYQNNVGYLNALRDVLKICEEISEDEFGPSS